MEGGGRPIAKKSFGDGMVWRDNSFYLFALTGSLTVCIIHIINSRELIKRLEAEGWTLRSVKGSHHVYTHPDKPGHISVPHPKSDLGIGLIHKLLKYAGIK
jgi:predicted RNA binding protein YcfA (HicA-like mRNA interferase family)